MDRDKKNSLWLAVQYGFSLVLSLIGLKLNLLTYGASEFSIWILLLSIWGVGAVLDLGFGISIVRFIARLKDDAEAVNHIVSTGFVVFLVLGLIIVLTGISVTELLYLGNPALIPVDKKVTARIVQLFLAANFFNLYISTFFRSVFEGADEFALPAKIALVSSIIQTLLILLTYALRLSLVDLGVFYFLNSVITLSTYRFFLRRYFPKIRLRLRNASFSTFRSIFSFSLSVQATFLLGAMIDPVIKFFLGTYTQRALIPPYEIARRFTSAVSGLFTSTFRNIFPKASMLTTREEFLSFLYREGTALARNGIVFSGMFFGVLSFVFFGLIVGFYGFREGVLLFFILALAESVNITGYVVYVFIVAVGRAAFLTLVQAINLFIIAVFLLVGFKLVGASMVLLGYYCAVLIANAAMLLFVRRRSGVSVGQFLAGIGIAKLALFHCLIIATILCMYYNVFNWYIVQAVFSIVCGILFFNDALERIERGRVYFRTYVMAFFR